MIVQKMLFAVLLSALSFSPFAQNAPGKNWEYADEVQLADWNKDALKNYRSYIRDSTVVTGVMIIHRGKVVFEYGDIEEISYIASCRKSVLAMLYGEHVENGTIDLSETIGDLQIDDVEGILPTEKSANVQDLISARSGVYHPEGYGGGMQEYAPERGSQKPGTYWLYSNWDFNVAGYVFEEKTGQNIYDEVERQLAIPLGMNDWNRSLQHKAGNTAISKYLAYPMWFSTRDMARIGQLMLNEGNWNGEQLISREWVSEMIEQRTSSKEINQNVPNFRNTGVNFGYGYMWWLFENMNDPRLHSAYTASGAYGQAITIYPNIETVLVYKTKATYQRMNARAARLRLMTDVVKAFEGSVIGAD